MHWGILLYSMFCLQIAYFREWACLDSNQGPLPYQRSTTLCRTFPGFAKYLQTGTFSARGFSRVCRRLTQVAARLLHTSSVRNAFAFFSLRIGLTGIRSFSMEAIHPV